MLAGVLVATNKTASQLLAAFHTNRTVTDISISNRMQESTSLGSCLFGLMQNMPQLNRLDCSHSVLGVEGVRAFQPALQTNRTLKQLHLGGCSLGDDGAFVSDIDSSPRKRFDACRVHLLIYCSVP
jgi:Leucine Rich repeat